MKKQMALSTDRKSASEGEYIEIKWACDACPDSLYLSIDTERTQYSIAVYEGQVVRLQGQHEVLVALPEEMAEGIVDRSAGYLVRSALLIHRKKARSEIVIRPGPDSISDAATMTSGLPEHQSL